MNDMIGYILAILVSMGTLITYTWNKKKLVADFFGNVQQLKFERKGDKFFK